MNAVEIAPREPEILPNGFTDDGRRVVEVHPNVPEMFGSPVILFGSLIDQMSNVDIDELRELLDRAERRERLAQYRQEYDSKKVAVLRACRDTIDEKMLFRFVK